MKTRGRSRAFIIGLSILGGVAAIAVVAAILLAGRSAPRRRTPPDHPLEAVFQPFSAGDVNALSEDRYYVDSQIVLTAARGVEKSAVEALAEKVGAEIVGYLELSGDYQLQFPGGKTAEELQAVAADLTKNAAVLSADIHYAYPSSLDDTDYTTPEWSPDALRSQWQDYTYMRDPWGDSGAEKVLKDYAIPGYPTGNDWWTEAVYLPQAWKVAEHSPMAEIKVGVIDSMFDTSHGDLNFAKTYLNPPAITGDGTESSHGTHVSGIIAAKGMNGREIRGASPNARLYGFAMSGEELDEEKHYDSDFKIKYAVAAMLGDGVRLFNLSMGSTDMAISAYYDSEVLGLDASNSRALSDLSRRSKGMQEFLERCEEIYPDFLIIESAGNNSGKKWVPANGGGDYTLREATKEDDQGDFLGVGGSGRYQSLGHIDPASRAAKHIMLVGSVDLTINVVGKLTEAGYTWTGPQNYMKSAFSDSGADIYAPGGTLTQIIDDEGEKSTETFDILSTIPENQGGAGMKRGTSMSAPLVTGIAALVWGYRPELTSEQLRFCLTNQTYATNALMGYTTPGLPIVDAMAAMRVADELLGPRRADAPTAEPAPELALFMGYAYTNPNHSDDPEDYEIDDEVTILLFDENWVQQVSYTQDGGKDFAVTAPPGKYYARIISADKQKEYIGEYELKLDEPTYDAVELQSRPYALYRFGVHQTIKSGEWYEIGAGTVSAEIAGFGGSINYEYDGHVTGYDPEDRSKLKAEATGALTQYGLEVAYTMNYENGTADYKYYPLGMQMDVGSPGIEPQFFDFDQITEEHLTGVDEASMEDYAFQVTLDEEQLSTLTFTAVGAFNDLTGFGLSDGVMRVEFNKDLSIKVIIFDVGASVEPVPYLTASAEYLLGYEFSDHPLREPRKIEAVDPATLEDLLYGLFG